MTACRVQGASNENFITCAVTDLESPQLIEVKPVGDFSAGSPVESVGFFKTALSLTIAMVLVANKFFLPIPEQQWLNTNLLQTLTINLREWVACLNLPESMMVLGLLFCLGVVVIVIAEPIYFVLNKIKK